MAIKKCPACGEEINKNEKRCPECGLYLGEQKKNVNFIKELDEDEEFDDEDVYEEIVVEKTSKKEKTKSLRERTLENVENLEKFSKWLKTISKVLGAIFIIIGVIGFFYLSGNSDLAYENVGINAGFTFLFDCIIDALILSGGTFILTVFIDWCGLMLENISALNKK